jgi:carbamate kinase
MGPKVDAICRFVELGGSLGAIGALRDAGALLRGEAGTVVRGPHRPDTGPARPGCLTGAWP